MDFDNQLIFFFSALGAFNGFVLSFYFALKAKRNAFSNYFLALLILMLSIRTIKSVFFHFNPQLAGVFIQIGLSALSLIGPFLYLYLKSQSKHNKVHWLLHVLPLFIGITLLGIFYPYVEHRNMWGNNIVGWINNLWFVYIAFSFRFILPSLKKIVNKHKVHDIDIWLISVYAGVFVVWCGYTFGTYTSYIVGALSFSFVLYLIVLLLIFKNNEKSTFFQEKGKYQNKKMDRESIELIEQGIGAIKEKELFLNPNLTIADVAQESSVSTHQLSQYLNEQMGKSFSVFINEYRIEKAQELLKSDSKFSIEGIGHESGFNSKSTFYTAFKKLTGMTPTEYRKDLGL